MRNGVDMPYPELATRSKNQQNLNTRQQTRTRSIIVEDPPIAKRLVFVHTADGYTIPLCFAEEIADTVAISINAVFSNTILCNQQIHNGFRTLLRHANVRSKRSSRRSIATNLHFCTRMRFQVVRYTLHVRKLRSIDYNTSKSEADNRF